MTQTPHWFRSLRTRHSPSVRNSFGVSLCQLPLTMACRLLQFGHNAMVQIYLRRVPEGYRCSNKILLVPKHAMFSFSPAMVAALIIAWSVSSECLWAVTNSSEQFLLLHPLVPKGSFGHVELVSSSTSCRLRKSSSHVYAVRRDV